MDSKRPVGRSEPEPIRQVVGFQVAGMEESPASLGKLARNKEQGGSDSSLQPLVTIVPTAFSGRRDSARGGGTPAESQTEVNLQMGEPMPEEPGTPTILSMNRAQSTGPGLKAPAPQERHSDGSTTRQHPYIETANSVQAASDEDSPGLRPSMPSPTTSAPPLPTVAKAVPLEVEPPPPLRTAGSGEVRPGAFSKQERQDRPGKEAEIGEGSRGAGPATQDRGRERGEGAKAPQRAESGGREGVQGDAGARPAGGSEQGRRGAGNEGAGGGKKGPGEGGEGRKDRGTDFVPKPRMTKEERRALQESQRLAKAEAKANAKTSKGASEGGCEGGKEPYRCSVCKEPGHNMRTCPHRQGGKEGGGEAAGGAGQKAAGQQGAPGGRKSGDSVRGKDAGAGKDGAKAAGGKGVPRERPRGEINQVELFAHLEHYDPSIVQRLIVDRDPNVDAPIHAAWLRMARDTAELKIVGGDARCEALLRAFAELIRDYEPPREASKSLGKDLLLKINKHVDFLLKFRPQASAMGNATRFVKIEVGKLPQDINRNEWPSYRDMLLAKIDTFLYERVKVAAEDTALYACDKVLNGDVVLTYCYSALVAKTLLEAKAQGKRFSVVVVDSRPRIDGQRAVEELTAAGISCQYADVTALSYIMREATKVLFAASAVLANGSVFARAGSAMVALVARSYSVPVIVLAETNKFHERVQLDAITTNELLDPRALMQFSFEGPSEAEVKGAANMKNLQLLNLNFDVTPADLVTVVATEAGLVPPSAVPVILREYRKDLHANLGNA